jgi:EpsI family protein
MSRARLLFVLLLVTGSGVLAAAVRRSAIAGEQPRLQQLPYEVSGWSGRDAAALDAETVQLVGADDYVNRSYTDGTNAPVGLYVAYYAQPRPGVSLHSPLNCLPGTGWEPLDVATIDLGAGQARRLIVRRNRERALVLYWYSIHGRALASEVASKIWLLHDSLRLRRSDAALVRIVVPLADGNASTAAAEARALAFARDVLPRLSDLWS